MSRPWLSCNPFRLSVVHLVEHGERFHFGDLDLQCLAEWLLDSGVVRKGGNFHGGYGMCGGLALPSHTTLYETEMAATILAMSVWRPPSLNSTPLFRHLLHESRSSSLKDTPGALTTQAPGPRLPLSFFCALSNLQTSRTSTPPIVSSSDDR